MSKERKENKKWRKASETVEAVNLVIKAQKAVHKKKSE